MHLPACVFVNIMLWCDCCDINESLSSKYTKKCYEDYTSCIVLLINIATVILKGLAKAKIIKISVIFFWPINMTI